MFRSYYAKVGQAMGGGDRLVAVTGALQGGLLRVIDVDVAGNTIGEPTYIPSTVPKIEMVKDQDGYLIPATEAANESQEIDWAAHESTTGRISGDSEDEAVGEDESIVSDGKVNPALAAFPHLQGE